MLSLTACGTPKTIDGSACPPTKKYKQADRYKLATELEGLPNDSIIPGFIADYFVLRTMVHECTITNR